MWPLLKWILRRCETTLIIETPLHQYDWGRAAEEQDWSVLSPPCTSCLWVAQWGWHGCHYADTDYFTAWSCLMLNSTHVYGYQFWLQVSVKHLPNVLCLRSSSTSMISPAWHSLQCLLLHNHSGNVLITNELLTHLCPDCVYFLNSWMQATIYVSSGHTKYTADNQLIKTPCLG